MTSISKCPVTEVSWNQRSVYKDCSPQDNYHCVRTQDNGVLELCTYPIWIPAGQCPIYDGSGQLDTNDCKPRRMFNCSTHTYKSNKVFNYPSCFPEKSALEREVTTDNSLPTSTYQLSTTFNNVSDVSGGNNSALAVLILILPIALGIVIFWKRRQIIQWIQTINTGRHTETSNRDSTGLTPVNETGHAIGDIEHGKGETDTLLAEDTKNEKIKENPNIQSKLEGNVLPSGNVQDPTIARMDNLQNVKIKTQRTLPAAAIENQRLKTPRNLIYLEIPKLSFVDKIAKELSTKQLVIITGLPGSGKSKLAHQIATATCQQFTDGANVRPVDDLSTFECSEVEKTTFLLFDNCIKTWFSKATIYNMFKKLSTAIKKGGGRVHALVCVPDIIFETFKSSLNSTSFEDKMYSIYDLNDDNIYKDKDWRDVFDCHVQSKKEMIKSLVYQEPDINAWRKTFIEIKATGIGKPAMAQLLFEDATNLQNVPNFLQNPYASLLKRITALSESNCESEQIHFVVLVVLMLNNGKANVANLNKDILTDICKSFNVEDTTLFEHVEYAELERNAEIVSVRCRETVRVTFDVVWEKRKDLVIKYCDEELFLERVSLTDEMTEQELIAINERFQSMISAGKFFIKDHCIVAKCLRETEQKKKQGVKLKALIGSNHSSWKFW